MCVSYVWFIHSYNHDDPSTEHDVAKNTRAKREEQYHTQTISGVFLYAR